MKFTPCDLAEDTPEQCKCWQSENGKYLLEINHKIFGSRVNLREKDGPVYLTEYCAGTDPIWMEALAAVVRKILLDVPEEMPYFKVERIFPPYGLRPMFRDPECWHKLLDMAKIETRDLEEIADLEI